MIDKNSNLTKIFNEHHKAVLDLIKITVENAHKEGKPVGICGDLAGDLSLTEMFIKLGIDELSVVPSRILELREKIRSLE